MRCRLLPPSEEQHFQTTGWLGGATFSGGRLAGKRKIFWQPVPVVSRNISRRFDVHLCNRTLKGTIGADHERPPFGRRPVPRLRTRSAPRRADRSPAMTVKRTSSCVPEARTTVA
jgi:hypothetical protein